MERKKEVTLFCLGFSVCVGGQRRSGACLFLLGFSWRRWRQQLHNLDPRIPPPPPPPIMWLEGPDHLTDFRTPPWWRLAVTRWHALCSQDCFLLSPLDLPPPHPSSPILSPHPSLPSENPASWVMAWSRVREATPDRMAMTWDMETVTSASSSPWPSHRPHPVCGQCRAGVWVFFYFCLLILPPFSKMEH